MMSHIKKTTLLAIFLLVQIFHVSGQPNPVYNPDSLRNLGYSLYNSHPEQCIDLIQRAAEVYYAQNNKTQAAFCYQNAAFAYNEQLQHSDSAIYFIEKAIPIWEETHDTLNLANILKYLGWLKAEQHQFEVGKVHIKQAINLFEAAKFPSGRAVAWFDMAKLFELQGKPDSSIHYYHKNKAFFLAKQDTLRIYLANTAIIRNYIIVKAYEAIPPLYESNLLLEASQDIQPGHKETFYSTSKEYFKLMEN